MSTAFFTGSPLRPPVLPLPHSCLSAAPPPCALSPAARRTWWRCPRTCWSSAPPAPPPCACWRWTARAPPAAATRARPCRTRCCGGAEAGTQCWGRPWLGSWSQPTQCTRLPPPGLAGPSSHRPAAPPDVLSVLSDPSQALLRCLFPQRPAGGPGRHVGAGAAEPAGAVADGPVAVRGQPPAARHGAPGRATARLDAQ
jgi:hypothetical protein